MIDNDFPTRNRTSTAHQTPRSGFAATVADLGHLPHLGRYVLKRPLTFGGLGVVYEAWDSLLSRLVAVKTLHFDVDTPARISLDGLFLHEARIAASLEHRGIVMIHDAGLSAQGVYIAMEHLSGRDLRMALNQGWQPSPARAARLARRVADALAYAHGKGVVHGDIRPENILLTEKGRPKLLDFGIARAAGVRGSATAMPAARAWRTTACATPDTGSNTGPDTHPPCAEADLQADLHALGLVLYELLTRHRPIADDRRSEGSASASPVPAHALNPRVPRSLSALAERAMCGPRQGGFATVQAFAQALRDWCDRHATPADEASGAVEGHRFVDVIVAAWRTARRKLRRVLAPVVSKQPSKASSPPPPIAIAGLAPLVDKPEQPAASVAR